MKRQPSEPRDRQSSRNSAAADKSVDQSKRTNQGNRSKRPSVFAVAKRWLINHIDIATNSLIRLLSSPIQTLLTILVVAVAICTPMLVYSFAQSIQSNVARLDSSTDISIYLNANTTEGISTQVLARVRDFDEVTSLSYISAEQGLEDFQDRTGLNDILGNLTNNPIPGVILVSVTQELKRDTEALKALANKFELIRGVDQVIFDYAWLARLQAIIDFMDLLIIVLGSLLGVGIALILGNTIRLEIENRRDEIVIVKLVGGTNAFVRRPLLYSGFWYGFMGAMLGWVLANVAVSILDQPLGDLSRLYISDFGLRFLDLSSLAVAIFFGAALGLAGAWLAVARHLSEIEPR